MNLNENTYEMIAKTSFGLEEVLADELTALGAEEITVLNRAVAFKGTMETMYRANLELRTALRILKPFYSFRVRDEVELYRETKLYEWSNLLNPKTTFAINSSVYSDNFNHSNYVSMKVKDAIVDNLREVYGKRPDVDIIAPKYRLDVHISDEKCTISLDSSGNSLHKRGYRSSQGLAPINEVLAAGMILLSGWKGDTNFIDPMCGSGTILMEAISIAYNIAPGRLIDDLGFKNWLDYSAELWEKLLDEAKSREKAFEHTIIGFDASPKAIKTAKENVKNAGLDWKVLLKVKNMDELEGELPSEGGTAIINPPYGERMSLEDAGEVYKAIGDALKKSFEGYSVWVISSNKPAMKQIGLRTSKKLTLFNGSLECKYHNYQMYKGSKKAKYQKNDSENN